ncbi:uncharacterized protein LOC125049390 [Pieris napi]|uniref:uncharacterized protein LOC125049390 n=1 Tax=Pieris napi TaxID=78633 RepID=UPI001FBB1492|nr:uncharacterized protein LOC125049390 [Pieris napi]
MEEEVEDIVGDVNYTDSQKSITASNVYSLDFTDSSSDKNYSSSKETYVIDCDDSDTSDKTYQSNTCQATFPLKDDAQTQIIAKQNNRMEATERTNRFDRDDSLQQYSLLSQEIFTQTSKTIFELAQNEKRLASTAEGVNSLQTQTSFISITENKTVEYHIQLVSDKTHFNPSQLLTNSIVYNTNFVSQAIADSLEDKSFCQESENEIEISKKNLTGETDDKIIKFVDDGSREDLALDENTNEYENSPCDSDIAEDSLDNLYQETDQDLSESSEIPKSVDNDIDDLYRKLSRCGDVGFYQDEKLEQEIPIVGILTPLTEETNVRKTSVTEISPSEETLTKNEDTKYISQITKSKSTVNPMKCSENQSHFRLPPINNFSCPNSPLNFLFSNACSNLIKTNTLPLVSDNRKERSRWKIDTNASGENPLININKDTGRYHSDTIQLPPINHGEGFIKKELQLGKVQTSDEANQDAISIKGKIRELKMTQRRPRMVSRSPSPTSTTCSPTETKLSDAAERGCEALCGELLRRLRLNSWVQALETLDELPKVLENFWPVIAEHRIAELIRQVSVHVDSARTQVSRVACHTLAAILKNTNYTKKPDFFEAIATLLVKTGSFCRPVRKAANVALDLVVCSVDVTHSVTAICVYGAGHKSALVRCATARLLVVCAAFAEGGRLLLRGRPPSAATARAHVLRALSHLLYDKNVDTRKYAERLYAMLRPLNNFEAYFLTDVDIETASRQMKKYDQIISTSKLT